ncbi:hypothetical protein EDB83DRAFT_2423578, partial [Lactarius deliciosus]
MLTRQLGQRSVVGVGIFSLFRYPQKQCTVLHPTQGASHAISVISSHVSTPSPPRRQSLASLSPRLLSLLPTLASRGRVDSGHGFAILSSWSHLSSLLRPASSGTQAGLDANPFASGSQAPRRQAVPPCASYHPLSIDTLASSHRPSHHSLSPRRPYFRSSWAFHPSAVSSHPQDAVSARCPLRPLREAQLLCVTAFRFSLFVIPAPLYLLPT